MTIEDSDIYHRVIAKILLRNLDLFVKVKMWNVNISETVRLL